MKLKNISISAGVAAMVLTGGVASQADAVKGTQTPPVTLVATRSCVDSGSGALVLNYAIWKTNSTGTNSFQVNGEQDRGYVQTVLKQDTSNPARWFAVPSKSGGEGVRRVDATYAHTGTGMWRVQFASGGVKVASNAIPVGVNC